MNPKQYDVDGYDTERARNRRWSGKYICWWSSGLCDVACLIKGNKWRHQEEAMSLYFCPHLSSLVAHFIIVVGVRVIRFVNDSILLPHLHHPPKQMDVFINHLTSLHLHYAHPLSTPDTINTHHLQTHFLHIFLHPSIFSPQIFFNLFLR